MTDWVARVNGQAIRRFDFENMVQGFAFERHRKTVDRLDDAEVRTLREMALEKLLARELLYQEALARGLVADEATIDAERQKIIANFPDEEAFYVTLEKAGITPLDYHRMLRQDMTVNLLTEQYLATLPDPHETAIADFYRNHPEKMRRQGRVRASHILLRIGKDGQAAAEAAILELRERCSRENFADLARTHSACPSATAGGDLGWFRRGDMAAEFSAVAFSLAEGEISAPVCTQFGMHLVMLTGREEDVPLTLDEARPQIIAWLRREAGAEQLQAWVAQLRGRSEIEIAPAVLSA